MGGKKIRPARVYKSVLNEMQNTTLPGHEVARPPWFDVLGRVPPAETLTRVPPVRHSAKVASSTGKPKKLRNLYRPQRIVHPEDKLRTTFFKDHPWELARPRIMVESDGKDYQRVDWSKGLEQPDRQLSGES